MTSHYGDETQAKQLMALLTIFDTQRRQLGHHAPLKTADLRLLWLFVDGRARTLKEIATELGLEQSTVNRQVNAAIRGSLLERCEDSPHQPYKFLPSQYGTQVFDDYMATTTDVYAETVASLGSEGAQFVALMNAFVAGFTSSVQKRS